jgi:hypothetical protein
MEMMKIMEVKREKLLEFSARTYQRAIPFLDATELDRSVSKEDAEFLRGVSSALILQHLQHGTGVAKGGAWSKYRVLPMAGLKQTRYRRIKSHCRQF